MFAFFLFRSALILTVLSWATAFALEKAGPVSPPTISAFIQRVDPEAKAEFCGEISTGNTTLYLFALTRDALTGFVLIRAKPGGLLTIEMADTAFSLFSGESMINKNIQTAISILVRPRETGLRVSAIGTRIDEIVGPLANFRLRSNSSREILKQLRSSAAYSLDLDNAPPGAIIVSPTTVLSSGRVALGHAGILGLHGVIFSADARFDGAWTQNYTLKRWKDEFAATNGTFAFVLRAPPKPTPSAESHETAFREDAD
jgi:hypothetical protein